VAAPHSVFNIILVFGSWSVVPLYLLMFGFLLLLILLLFRGIGGKFSLVYIQLSLTCYIQTDS